MRGRPPKSTAEHRRDGTYEPSRHDGRADEMIAVGEPDQPEWMAGDALSLWEKVVATLPDGAQSLLDTGSLAGCCWWYGRWCDLRRRIDDSDGDEYKLTILAATAWKNFEKTASQFGMSPAARSRLSLPKEEGKSALDILLGARNAN